MSRAPGRRINKRRSNAEDAEDDKEIAQIANGIEEYIVLTDSSSQPSRSSSSSSMRSSSSAGSQSNSNGTHQAVVVPLYTSEHTSGHISGHISHPVIASSAIPRVENVNSGKGSWSKMDNFIHIYSVKKYCSGYLYMIENGEWIKIYAEIRGNYLRGWKVSDEIAAETYEPEPLLENILSKELCPTDEVLQVIQEEDPALIQTITDSSSFVFPCDYTHNDISPLPPIPYTCFFRVNLRTFAAYSYISANSWIHSIRLSAFEYGQLNIYFSLNLLRVVPYIRIWSDFEILPFKTKNVKRLEWDGDCKIRLCEGEESKSVYCVTASAGNFIKDLLSSI